MRITTIAAALGVAALTAGLATPANAEAYGVDDPAETGHGSDIISVTVRNRPDVLVVRTFHEDLRKDPKTGSGGTVFVDTDPENQGPEFAFVAGYTDGTDYVLLQTDGFAPSTWGDPVDFGDYSLRVRYLNDTVTMKMSRDAISNKGDVRVAIRAAGASGPTDWVGEARSFTPWIGIG